MKNVAYCISGSLMLIVAVVLKVLAGGNAEILILIGSGLLLLAASADTPHSTKGNQS